MPQRRTPTDMPETLKVVRLTQERTKKAGRKKKLTVPELPAEIWDAMSSVEQAYYTFWTESVREENPDLTNSDHIYLMLAGLELINVLRTAEKQISAGELITMARQHPGLQFRSLVDMLSVSRKARKSSDKGDKEPATDLSALWKREG